MNGFQSSTWSDVDTLRAATMARPFDSLEGAAQAFAKMMASSSPTTVLSRVFGVLPFEHLSSDDQAFAQRLVHNHSSLSPRTPVLTLLGTDGRAEAWGDRAKSAGHRAIPLLGLAFVMAIPMISKLLVDLEVNLAGLDDGTKIATRRLLGGRNGAFFVEDARTTRDSAGRLVIPSQDFVAANDVKTVFGMGGAYLDGTLIVSIVFTNESIDRLVVDRFPSLIGNFKIATSKLVAERKFYAL